jgi:hypothetical protein
MERCSSRDDGRSDPEQNADATILCLPPFLMILNKKIFSESVYTLV